MTVGVLLVLVFVCFAGCCWLDWVVCCLSLVNLLFCSDYLCCCFCVLRVVILDLRFGVLWDLLFWICVSFAFPGWRPYCCICFLVLLYFAGFVFWVFSTFADLEFRDFVCVLLGTTVLGVGIRQIFVIL